MEPLSIPPIIPAYTRSEDAFADQAHRKIVICLDGTGDQFDGDNSNIVKFFAALKKDDPQQLCYYQSGIGTYSKRYGGSLSHGISATLDMAVGITLGHHVRDAYKFLMQNYKEGDKICLFAFSRGSHAARALAGMLFKVGLLSCGNEAQLSFAYKWYKDDTPEGWRMSLDFKRTFSIDVHVYMLGLFDCVASVGIIPRYLPFSNTCNETVKYFRHALALDERRAKFQVNHWYKNGTNCGKDEHSAPVKEQVEAEEDLKKQEGLDRAFETIRWHQKAKKSMSTIEKFPLRLFGEMERDATKLKGDVIPSIFVDEKINQHYESSDEYLQQGLASYSLMLAPEISIQSKLFSRKDPQDDLGRRFSEAEAREFGANESKTDVMEAFFIGGHADCGGGAVVNETRHMLSRIPLRWMTRQCFATGTGILFHSDVLTEHGMDVETLWPALLERKAPKVGPSPTLLDLFASKTLPGLDVRRDTFKCRFMSPQMPSFPSSPDTSTTLVMRDGSISPSTLFGSPPRMMGSKLNEASTVEDLCFLPEHYEDYFDAMAPINDQLKQNWLWWILEFLPIKYKVKDQIEDKWVDVVGPNLGRPRSICDPQPYIHWTVKEREKAGGYKIRCVTNQDVRWRVTY